MPDFTTNQVEGEQLKAGRQLDMLVAEHVLGWVRGPRWGNGNGPWIISGIEGRTWDTTPHFSTDIAAAMSVRDHIRDTWKFSDRRCFVIELIQIVSLRTAGTLGVKLADSSVMMNFNAEDICRAALAATRVENEKRNND